MRHRVKKNKFGYGIDANRMLTRKLARNFFERGKIVTTLKKAKMLKSIVEALVEKTKENKTSNENYLLRQFGDKNFVRRLFSTVGADLKKISGGYVRIIKLGQRFSDGAETARVEWVYPIIKESNKTKESKKIK